MSVAVFFTALASAMLINNVILMRFLGICPFLGVSKKIESSIGMSFAVAFVMLVATLFTYIIYYTLLEPFDIEYLRIIAFILVIASLVQFVEMFIKKFSKGLYKSLGIYLPLITTNCAILGVAEGNIIIDFNSSYNFFGGLALSLTNALGAALGFGLIMFAFSAIRVRLDAQNVPKEYKGVPISLVVAGIMSLAFFGLQGLI
ncbi:RnfABCDGE type electron transport complex subunit A [Mycoplasmatota bacterium]|nr:RnfABCDGE type electron transport complex subunit A [Mycoplasmatota bacterium]